MTAPAPDTFRSMRGRPSKRDAVLLRQRIHGAALDEFRQHGYAGTSIDAIARAAAVSRTTIYALYTDKPTLFTEMIEGTITAPDIASLVDFDDRAPSLVLRDALIALNRAYYREPNLDLVRLCIAETDRFPLLFEKVRALLETKLTGLIAYFERLHRSGIMMVADSYRAALMFNMLSLGSLKPFFLHQDRLTTEEVSGHLDLALAIFMNGCLTGKHGLPEE